MVIDQGLTKKTEDVNGIYPIYTPLIPPLISGISQPCLIAMQRASKGGKGNDKEYRKGWGRKSNSKKTWNRI